jgi:hypothetical protein
MKLTINPQSLLSEAKLEKAFQFHTEGRRRAVNRSTHSALSLINPDEPIKFHEGMEPFLPSLNAFSIRMHSKYTLNDSCIVSESMISRLRAMKQVVQTIQIPKTTIYNIHVEKSQDPVKELSYLSVPRLWPKTGKSHIDLIMDKSQGEIIATYVRYVLKCYSIIRPNQVILTGFDPLTNRNLSFRTNVRSRPGAVVMDIITEEEEHSYAFTFVYDLITDASIGDKLMTQTGHKFTIGKILPDKEMPIVENQHVDLVTPFAVGKRCTPSYFLEEAVSLCIANNVELFIEDRMSATQIYNIAKMHLQRLGINYPGTLSWKNQTYSDPVPYGYIRIYRLDNVPSEHCKLHKGYTT